MKRKPIVKLRGLFTRANTTLTILSVLPLKDDTPRPDK